MEMRGEQVNGHRSWVQGIHVIAAMLTRQRGIELEDELRALTPCRSWRERLRALEIRWLLWRLGA